MLRPTLCCLAVCLLSACPDGGVDDVDGGVDDVDGGVDTDAGNDDPDAGNDDPDAGNDDPDAGDVDPDAGVVDAGSDDPDAGAVDPADPACITDCGVARPEDDGPFDIDTFDDTFASAGDTIEVTVVFPVGAPLAPVVVFHPGFRLGKDLYQSYADSLASHGFVAVLVDPPDALFGGPNHRELAVALGAAIDFVAEEASGDLRLDGIADLDRVALAGHSLGGKLALLRATSDARVDAVFAIDPVDAAGGPGAQPSADFPSVTPELMDDLTVPVVLVGETENATCTGAFCQACAPAADNFLQYWENVDANPALLLDMQGANHMSFLDNPDCGFSCNLCDAGTDDPTETRRRTRRALNAFVRLTFDDDQTMRPWLTGVIAQADAAAGFVVVESQNGF